MARRYRRRFVRVWLALTSLGLLAVALLALIRYPEPVWRDAGRIAGGIGIPDAVATVALVIGISLAVLILGLALIWVIQGFGVYEPQAGQAAAADPRAAPKPPADDCRAAAWETDALTVLRRDPGLLEPGLREVEPANASTASMDRCALTAEDGEGNLVLIAFEPDTAELDAVVHMLATMGAVAETESRPVRGFLVARDFGATTRHAARAAPGLALRRHRVSVLFDKV